jgi:hypothetical protein
MAQASFSRERVVIVGKTRMRGGVCIGGMVQETGLPVRLLPIDGFCHLKTTSFQVGEVWEMCLKKRTGLTAPHSEDHDEWNAHLVATVADLSTWIRSKCKPVRGAPSALFGGRMRFTSAGKGFLRPDPPVPDWSTDFWEIPFTLVHYKEGQADRYRADQGATFDVKHVGHQTPVDVIPRGSLVRVSLARWSTMREAPDRGEECWLQLSGWF